MTTSSANSHNSPFYAINTQAFILKVISIIAVIFVFEEAIYGRLGLSSTLYLLAKTSTEAFLYLLLMLVVAHQFVNGRLISYKPTLFDYCLVTFIAVALLSTFINHGSLLQAGLNIRTMLRYVAVYYIIVFSGWVPTERQILGFVKFLVGLALFQSILIVFQHIAGDAFREAYFSSNKVEFAISGINKIIGGMETKIGAGYGTFGKTPLAAFFLLFVSVITVAFALSLHTRSSTRWWLAYGMIFLGLYFTYKRAPMLLCAIAPVAVAWASGRKRLVRRYLLIGMLMGPLMLWALSALKPDTLVKEKEAEISPVESMAQLFSSEYWDRSSSKSRGWMILEVGSQALSSFKPIGYGGDEGRARAVLAAKGGEFGKLVSWGAFDDVYIVATLVYYGPIGVGLLMLAIYSIYRQSKHLVLYASSSEFRILGVTMSIIIIYFLFSVFVVRLPEFRAFAFLFWVNAAIVATAYTRIREARQLREIRVQNTTAWVRAT